MVRLIECEGDLESVIRAMNLIKYIRGKCTEYNENFVIIAVGMPGKGKTMGSCSLAELLDDDFDESRVAVNYTEFFNLINNHDPPLPPGSVIIYDEFQQSANSRDWQNVLNRAISDVVNTFRSRRLITIITTPRMALIDKNVRCLLNMRMDFKRKNLRKKYSVAVPYFQEVNNTRYTKQESWEWMPRIFEHGIKKKMNAIHFSLPTIHLRKAVDRKIDDFKRQVALDAQAKMSVDDVKEEENKLDFKGMVDIVKRDTQRFMGKLPNSKKPPELRTEKIMMEFGVNRTTAQNIRGAVLYT